MQGIPGPEDPRGPRWQYVILWRYGGLGLASTGLAMIGYGASGAAGAAISVTLITLGFAALIAGVVLPRIDGKFSAGSTGVTAELLAVHKLDAPTFTTSAPALAAGTLVAVSDTDTARGEDREAMPLPITLGDVWDALENAGFQVTAAALGKRLLTGPHGRSIFLHGPELLGGRVASEDLLAQLASWGIQPAASGKYHPPLNANESWDQPYSALPLPPADQP